MLARLGSQITRTLRAWKMSKCRSFPRLKTNAGGATCWVFVADVTGFLHAGGKRRKSCVHGKAPCCEWVSELDDAPSCEVESDRGDEVVWTDVRSTHTHTHRIVELHLHSTLSALSGVHFHKKNNNHIFGINWSFSGSRQVRLGPLCSSPRFTLKNWIIHEWPITN